MKPYVVGLSGGTCSGKSTLSRRIEEVLGTKYKMSTFNMDKYYDFLKMKTIAPITRIEYIEHNHPSAVDIDKLYADFLSVTSDNSVDIVILEGIFAFHFDQLREKLDLKVFVDLLTNKKPRFLGEKIEIP